MTQELASAAVSETSAPVLERSARRCARCANPGLVGGRSVQPDQFSARQIEALENEQWADLPSGRRCAA